MSAGTFAAVAVACRGEIGVRVAHACRELGVRSIALHAPDDAGSLHVRACDDAVEVPSYLDAVGLARGARDAGADALHPGYGFLAEDASLAEACRAWDIVFVGPPPAALRAVARKDEARRIAQGLGIDVLPGGDDPALLSYPLLVKAAAGGGGRGQRIVLDATGLEPAIESARREALAAFADEALIFERFVERPRHVEIQLLCDAHGHGIHLGERDCSVQRRHQKVLEEAPAPGVSAELRAQLGGWALRIAEAVGYVGAGTVEFLLDEAGRPFFLELNARIQVEHPVTEAVTAIDLVRRQLEIAAGEPLLVAQGEVLLRGHAVEARIYAEDPDSGFLPTAGPLLDVRWPTGPGIRVDAGVAAGDVVGTRYDPLLAKLIAHGETRERALRRLTAALDETLLLGLTTNLPFLRWLVRHDELRAGPVTTRFIEERFEPAPLAALPAEVIEAAALHAARERGASPWQGRWRPAAAAVEPALPVARGDDGAIHVWWHGRSLRVPQPGLARADELAHRPAAGAGAAHARITAPMPGTVLRVEVAEGDEVAAGSPLLVLEAMKMEHPLTAPFDGRVAWVGVRAGAIVQAGDALVEVGEPGDDGAREAPAPVRQPPRSSTSRDGLNWRR